MQLHSYDGLTLQSADSSHSTEPAAMTIYRPSAGTRTCLVKAFNRAAFALIFGILLQAHLTNGDACMLCLMETGAIGYTSIARNPAFLVRLNATELGKLCSTFSSIQDCANQTGCSDYINAVLQSTNSVSWTTLQDALTLLCSDIGKRALLYGQRDCYTLEFEKQFGDCFMRTFNQRPSVDGSWCTYSDALRSLLNECLPDAARSCHNESVDFVLSLLDIILPTVPADQVARCRESTTTSMTTSSHVNDGVRNSVTTSQLIMTSSAVVLLTSSITPCVTLALAASFCVTAWEFIVQL